jgi:hypothetical protein
MTKATEPLIRFRVNRGGLTMRPVLGAILFMMAILPAEKPVLAEESVVRTEMVQLPGGGQVRVLRGPALGGQAETPPPAAPRPEVATVAAGGILWLVGDDQLTACWVRKTSYVNGYRIRCLNY